MKECKVYCSKCKEWLTPKQAEFLDIQEDPYGRDNVTFICNECKTENKSLVISQDIFPVEGVRAAGTIS